MLLSDADVFIFLEGLVQEKSAGPGRSPEEADMKGQAEAVADMTATMTEIALIIEEEKEEALRGDSAEMAAAVIKKNSALLLLLILSIICQCNQIAIDFYFLYE